MIYQTSLIYYDSRIPSSRPSLCRLLGYLALVISLFPKANFGSWTRNSSYLSPRSGNIIYDTEDPFSTECSLIRQYRFNKFLTSLGNSPINSSPGCIAAKILIELDTKHSFSVRLNRVYIVMIHFESSVVSITGIGGKIPHVTRQDPISSSPGCIAAKIPSEPDTKSSFAVQLNRMNRAI